MAPIITLLLAVSISHHQDTICDADVPDRVLSDCRLHGFTQYKLTPETSGMSFKSQIFLEFFDSVRISRNANLHTVQTCLELSIFIILAQVSFRSLLGLS